MLELSTTIISLNSILKKNNLLKKSIYQKTHQKKHPLIDQKTPSKKGTYVSVSINVVMKSPDTVIEKYKEVGRLVEGVISL